jgi:putative methionine-R-sulfoxide reductase with GAF domain
MAYGRDYVGLMSRHGLSAQQPRACPPEEYAQRCRAAIDLLWGGVGSQGVSWIGIYEIVKPQMAEMVLTCREPKPACSPIGLHGMCGKGWKEARSVIIKDVATLGENYIACDPKDRSELVIPLIDGQEGRCLGVLDVDSYDTAAFDAEDARGMALVLAALGLTPAYVAGMEPVYL